MGDAALKVCTKCALDVSALKRHKDAKGRYWCEGCFARAAAKQSAPGAKQHQASEPVDSTPAWLAGSLAIEGKRCEQCNGALPKDAVICNLCGFNSKTGKAVKTAVFIEAPEKEASATGQALGNMGRALEGPGLVAMSAVGGLAGGAVGATLYALITQASGYELWFLIWVIGVTTGIGVAAVAKGYRGMMTGVISVVIAMICFIGGRFWAASMIMDKMLTEVAAAETTGDYAEGDAVMYIADEVVIEYEAAGRTLVWPPGMTIDFATEQEDYPPEVWTEAERRWGAMTPTQQQGYLRTLASRQQEAMKSYGAIAIFFMSLGLRHVIAVVLLCVGAWKFGAG